MRIYLEHSQEGLISLEEEIRALELYLELEEVRFGHDVAFTIEKDPALEMVDVELPAMLLQPYVENAIKHGLHHKTEDRQLTIHFTLEEEEVLKVEIIDNGIGRAASAAINKRKYLSHKSFATQATHDRLTLINKDREQPIEVKTVDLLANEVAIGTKVLIIMPLEMAY